MAHVPSGSVRRGDSRSNVVTYTQNNLFGLFLFGEVIYYFYNNFTAPDEINGKLYEHIKKQTGIPA